MENKYYTPEIEEFHVGFEYEFTDNVVESEWQKAIIKDGTQIDDITRKHKGANAYSLRVKHLDKEDIESLGWENTNSSLLVENCFEFYLENRILSFCVGSDVHIYENKYDPERSTIFFGELKNISELRKIMKQLNIKAVTEK